MVLVPGAGEVTAYHRADRVDLHGYRRDGDTAVVVVSYELRVEFRVVLGEENRKLCLVLQVFKHASHEELVTLKPYSYKRRRRRKGEGES